MLLPYLQPFADGNMRTSRLVANAVLLAYGYPPLSYRSVYEQTYKGMLILFYEQGARSTSANSSSSNWRTPR